MAKYIFPAVFTWSDEDKTYSELVLLHTGRGFFMPLLHQISRKALCAGKFL